MFWNIAEKNLIDPLIQIILENKTDVVALAEAGQLDINSLLNALGMKGCQWKSAEVCPGKDIRLLVKKEVTISVHQEEKRFSSYKMFIDNRMCLLHVVHLSSTLHWEESARNDKAVYISQVLRKMEEKLFGKNEYNSMVVGDFNLQPYAGGIAGVYGFNATMSISKAMQRTRKVDGKLKYFYFNPIWKLMGDHKDVQGSYYNDHDQQGKSITQIIYQ